MAQALGRNSVVGTTTINPDAIPLHIRADINHTWISGEKAYIVTTVGGEYILGASVAKKMRQRWIYRLISWTVPAATGL